LIDNAIALPPQDFPPLARVTPPWIKPIAPRYPIRGCADAALYFTEKVYSPFTDFMQEEFVVLLLDSTHSVRYEISLYRGIINSVMIRIAEVFREAIRLNAYAILVAHNHPSGSADPSQEDIAVTEALQAAGKLLDIQVLDHLVIGEHQWTSLRQKGAFGSLTLETFAI
jgi:DNA repair protein RadC